MRDIITIFAAGALMTAYVLIAPTIVEAVQSPARVSQKVFAQRLAQVGGESPISTVSGTLTNGVVVAHGSALPRFVQY